MICSDHDQLRICLEVEMRSGKRIGLLNGCFDLTHALHVELLQKAKSLCDTLVVAINSDNSVRKLKGEGRPIFPQDHRLFILDAFECVDYVVVFEETTVVNLLKSNMFSIWCKGSDYSATTLNKDEVAAAEKNNMTIALIPCKRATSTTKIIDRILISHSEVMEVREVTYADYADEDDLNE